MRTQFEFCAVCQKPVDVRDRKTVIGYRGLPESLDQHDYMAAVERATVAEHERRASRRQRKGYIFAAAVIAGEQVALLSDDQKVVMARAYEELGATLTAAHSGCVKTEENK